MKKIITLLLLLFLCGAANSSQGIVGPQSGGRPGSGDGGPSFHNYIYSDGHPLVQFDTQFNQMVHRGFGVKGFDIFPNGRTGRSTVIRIDSSALLIGKMDGGSEVYMYILGDKKDLGRFKLAYGGFGGIVAGSSQEVALAGIRASADYASKNLRLGPNSKAMLKSRGEIMGQFNYGLKSKDLRKDFSMVFEVTPVAQIDNVLGGDMTIEFTTQIVPNMRGQGQDAINPESREMAGFRAVNMMPRVNAAYGSVGYERKILPSGRVFSKVLIGTISKNAFIHTNAGYRYALGNDKEITIVIGYIDTMGKADPALAPLSKLYGSAAYSTPKFQVNLGVYKDLIEYKGNPDAKKLPQIRLRANLNLDKAFKTKKQPVSLPEYY